jgi:glucosamine 6-phosphate synthetase-like amidotransferase/phosphosugar isomerase protein
MSADGNRTDDEYAVMLREIALQPGFVRTAIDGMVERARASVGAHPGRRVNGGFIIGCGDSFAAGMAARGYVMATTRRWLEPLEALEFSRYLVSDLPPASYVIGVSNSGTVARTIEGVRLARERDAWTFAVTVGATNTLARTAETLVEIDTVPNIKQRADGTKMVTPGTLTYTASLVGIVAGAIALGEQLGELSARGVSDALAELHRVAEWMAQADAVVAALAPELAATFTRDRTTVILGGGPNVATAYFAAAKWYEAMQWPAHHAQIEEWAHEQYFFTGAQTDTIVILPPGGSHERGLEQLRAAREMGSRTIAIAAGDDTAAAAAADIVIPMPVGIPESLTPFVYKLPFEYLAAHIAAQHRIDFFGFANPQRQAVNFRQIFDSAQTPSNAR